MATAALRIVIDPDGNLSAPEYETGIARLQKREHDVIAGLFEHLPDQGRELTFLVEVEGVDPASEWYLAECREAFNVEPTLGVITYISRGTEEDAYGVLARFGVTGDVRSVIEEAVEVFIVSISESAARNAIESLHTALEAALNAEVRIEVAARRAPTEADGLQV